jgi:hypothetical protein
LLRQTGVGTGYWTAQAGLSGSLDTYSTVGAQGVLNQSIGMSPLGWTAPLAAGTYVFDVVVWGQSGLAYMVTVANIVAREIPASEWQA